MVRNRKSPLGFFADVSLSHSLAPGGGGTHTAFYKMLKSEQKNGLLKELQN